MGVGIAIAWARVAAEACAALALFLLAEPGPLPRRTSFSGGLVLAVVTGAALVLVLARRRLPRLRLARERLPIVAAKAGVLCLSALCEEVVWRWYAIGALVERAGVAAALVASTIGFALLHCRQGVRAVPVHLITGSAFGGLFLATGSLAAAATAHATYNLGILGAVESRRGDALASARGTP